MYYPVYRKGSFRPLKLSMVQRGSKDAAVVFINSYQTGKNYDDSLLCLTGKHILQRNWLI